MEQIFYGVEQMLRALEMLYIWASGANCASKKVNFIKSNDMSDQNTANPNQLNIELTEDVAEGIYSNLAIISHSHSEFVLDFIRMMPNVPKAKVKARMVLTPQHAKRLLRALMDNIQKYEQQFGPIQDPEPQIVPPMAFNTPTAQA